MWPLFKGYNGDLNGKQCWKINIAKKAFSDGPNAIPRPPFDSNVAKVPIVKWSQNLIFVDRSVISGVPQFLENTCFVCIFKNLG